MTTHLQRLLAQAADLERESRSADVLGVELADVVGIAIEQQRAHLRLVVDFVAPAAPRLRLRVIDRNGGWWACDTWGICALPPKDRCARLDPGPALS